MISLKTCIIALPVLFSSVLMAQTVTINPATQRYIGGVSDLDRSKYFTLHSGTTTDPDLVQFYNDYDVVPSRGFWGPFTYAKNQTGVVGQYLPDVQGSGGVRPIRQNYIATEHPSNVIRYNLSNTAAADWVVEYYKDYVTGEVPEYYEPMNEPFIKAGEAIYGAPNATAMREKMADWYAAIGQKVDQTPELANMKIIGYSSAWPNYETSFGGATFSHWNSRQKMFMDRAGLHMDAFSVHLYDGINANQDGGERSGSNAVAILDMIEAYSYIKWGVVKPHAISESGGIASGYPAGWNDIEAAQSVMSSNKLIFDFLDRTDRIEHTIPFISDKSTWHLTAANNYEPYGAVLLRPENVGQGPPNGNWVYTPKITFYEMWRNVKGKRIDVRSDHPDIQIHGFVDGNKLYVALNNLDDATHNVSLNYASSIPGLQNVRIKRLKIYRNSPHSLSDTTQTSAPSSITMIEDETVVLEYTYNSAITFNNAVRSETYYTNKYLQYITANVAQSYTFSGVPTTASGYAKLKMAIGRSVSASKSPTVVVNGTEVAVPTNWKGYDQADRGTFFGTIEIPVPIGLIQTTNTVTLTFPDTNGAVSSLILELAKYDSAPNGGGNGLPFGGGAHAIPGLIEAEDFNIGGQGVAYNDAGGGNNGDSNYRNGEGVDITDGSGANPARLVGWISNGEWLEYDVNVTPDTFNIEANVASAASNPGDLAISIDGISLGTFAVGNTGGWETLETVTIPNVTLGIGGIRNLRLTAVGGSFNIDSIRFVSTSGGGGDVDVAIDAEMFDAESHPADQNLVRAMTGEVGYIKGGTWIRFDSFDFGFGAGSVDVSASSGTTGGRVEFRLGSPTGTLIGSVDIAGTGGWSTYQTSSGSVNASGVHDLYLVFVDSNSNNNFLFNVQSFTFNAAANNADLGVQVEAELYDAQNGVQVVGGTKVGYVENGDWIRFDAMEVAGATSFTANVASGASGGTVEIRTGSATGTLIGSVSVGSTGGWSSFQNVSTNSLSGVSGTNDVYLVFTGGGGYLLDVNWFRFD